MVSMNMILVVSIVYIFRIFLSLITTKALLLQSLGPKIFKTKEFFGHKNVFNQINFFGQKIFSTLKYFRPKTFYQADHFRP